MPYDLHMGCQLGWNDAARFKLIDELTSFFFRFPRSSSRRSVLTSLLSIVMEAAVHPVVLVSGFLGLLLSPYAAFQQRKLTQVEALGQTNAVLEAQVSELEVENAKLRKSVQEMEESVIK